MPVRVSGPLPPAWETWIQFCAPAVWPADGRSVSLLKTIKNSIFPEEHEPAWKDGWDRPHGDACGTGSTDPADGREPGQKRGLARLAVVSMVLDPIRCAAFAALPSIPNSSFV